MLAALLATLGAPVATAASAPTVQVMVVGRGGTILSGPRSVSATATSVAVGGRHCAVPAATPLAVLASLARVGGPAFALRDYGHCGPAPRDSGELFVDRVAGQTNSGRDGWEYKVGALAGTTGAADSSGILGNGRLIRSGQRVLWFWCQTSAGGCQRTLELSAPSIAPPGGEVSVRVTGYDNEGRRAPVRGAVVGLGSDFATTDSSGQAALIVPASAGRYSLSAARSGLVPAFPQTIVVR